MQARNDCPNDSQLSKLGILNRQLIGRCGRLCFPHRSHAQYKPSSTAPSNQKVAESPIKATFFMVFSYLHVADIFLNVFKCRFQS